MINKLTNIVASFPNFLAGLPVISTPIKNRDIIDNARRAVPASCGTTVTPTCLQDLYGIPATKATTTTNVRTFLKP